MYKRIRKFGTVILTGLTLLVFSACSGKDSETDVMQDRAGSYELTSIVRNGQEAPPEDLILLEEKGLSCRIILEKDGSGVLDLFGDQQKVTWDAQSITADGKVRQYTYEDHRLTLTNEDSELTFTRSADH
ncbi:MAG: hypothetical protein IKG34_11015 [Solobacterium sp.]|nr:hypothetical protein [Solobacterium sp.]